LPPLPPDSFTLSLHDALPIYMDDVLVAGQHVGRIGERTNPVHIDRFHAFNRVRKMPVQTGRRHMGELPEPEYSRLFRRVHLVEPDRKSTRLNPSHVSTSNAVL